MREIVRRLTLCLIYRKDLARNEDDDERKAGDKHSGVARADCDVQGDSKDLRASRHSEIIMGVCWSHRLGDKDNSGTEPGRMRCAGTNKVSKQTLTQQLAKRDLRSAAMRHTSLSMNENIYHDRERARERRAPFWCTPKSTLRWLGGLGPSTNKEPTTQSSVNEIRSLRSSRSHRTRYQRLLL